MKKAGFLLVFFIFTISLFLFVKDIKNYLDKNNKPILSTPLGFEILSVSFSETEKTVTKNAKEPKNTDIKLEEIEFYEWGYALGPILISVFFAGLIFLFFIFNIYIQKKEFYFLQFCFFLIAYYLSFLDYVMNFYLGSLFYFIALFYVVPLILFLRSLFNLKTSPWFSVSIFAFSALLVFQLNPNTPKEETRLIMLISIIQFFGISYGIVLFLNRLRQYLSKDSKRLLSYQNTAGIFILASVFLLSFFSPISVISLLHHLNIKTSAYYNLLFVLPVLPVITYFLLGIRFGLFTSKIIINEILFRLIFLVFFFLMYLIFIGYYFLSMAGLEESLWFHLGIAFVFLLLFDPIRSFVSLLLDDSLIQRNTILSKYLIETSSYINDPISLNSMLEKISESISSGLEVRKVALLFKDASFPSLTNTFNMDMEQHNTLWKELNKKRKITKYPIFTKSSSKNWGLLLKRNNAFLLIGFQKFDAGIIVSDKLASKAFSSADIKFLRAVVKQGELLIQNYFFIQENNKIKRQQNELLLAASIQKKILFEGYSDKNINVCSIIEPYQKVTGDYLDFFKKSSRSYMLFLGDVSGHGLGSSYLMNIIWSFMRGAQLINQERLSQTFNHINQYLAYEYEGNDFLTLFGVEVKLVKNKDGKNYSILEFINAGQHPALIYLKELKQLKKLSFHQKALGFVKANYKINSIKVEEPFRIFIYSDGLFEIFDKHGKILGEKNVHRWIKRSSTWPIEHQKEYIKKQIRRKAKTAQIMDDISMVIAEVNLL